MNIEKENICPECYGAGGDFVSFDPVAVSVMCESCKGTGKINKSVLFRKNEKSRKNIGQL